MSQILRIIKPEVIQIRRFYGGHRNLQTHYETLRISPDASTKDIRLAFIKLSKEMHPDMSKKTSDKDFVRVNEAYQVLSKALSRRQYDMELQASRTANGRPIRVVYYEGSKDFYPRQGPISQNPNDYGDNYYSVRGIRRVSNLTIAVFCIVLSAIGLSIQVLLVSKSIVFRRDQFLERSGQIQDSYRKIRTDAIAKDQNQQIEAFEQRLAGTGIDGAKFRS